MSEDKRRDWKVLDKRTGQTFDVPSMSEKTAKYTIKDMPSYELLYPIWDKK